MLATLEHTPAMITLRPVNLAEDGRIAVEDFELVSPWWEDRGGQSPTREMLPGMGAIAFRNDEPLACAFCYLDATGSGVAMLGWLATRPGASAHRAGRAMRAIMTFLETECRRLNYWLLMGTYHHPCVLRMLKQMGFLPADTGMVQLFKPL